MGACLVRLPAGRQGRQGSKPLLRRTAYDVAGMRRKWGLRGTERLMYEPHREKIHRTASKAVVANKAPRIKRGWL